MFYCSVIFYCTVLYFILFFLVPLLINSGKTESIWLEFYPETKAEVVRSIMINKKLMASFPMSLRTSQDEACTSFLNPPMW